MLSLVATCLMCCIFSNSDLDRLMKIMPPATYIINNSQPVQISYHDEIMMIDDGKVRMELEGNFHVNYRFGRVDVMVFDAHKLGDLSTIMTLQFRHGELSSIRIESVMVNSRGHQISLLNVQGS